MFATHFHELSELHDFYPNALRNVCVATHFLNSQLIMLYKIVNGVASQSFGLNIAEHVGLTPDLLEVPTVFHGFSI